MGKTSTAEDGTFTISIDPTKYNDDNHLLELNVLNEHYALANTSPFSSVINDPRFIFYCDSSLIDSTAAIEVQLIPKSYVTISIKSDTSNIRSVSLEIKRTLASYSKKFLSTESFPLTITNAAYLDSELEVTFETKQNTITQKYKLESKGLGETQVLEIGL